MLEKYESYLKKVTDEINSYFAEQKDYLKCKAGCGICCSNGYYPISEIEYKYLKKGFEPFYSQEDMDLLHEKVWEIYKNREIFRKSKDINEYAYVCPFLKNDMCSLYEHRPIVCRMYGLLVKDPENREKKGKMAYCVNQGLNYANVWDFETKRLSLDKINALGLKVMPKSYDVSCTAIMDSFEGIIFGDIRMLYEWIIMDIPGYEDIMKKCKEMVQ